MTLTPKFFDSLFLQTARGFIPVQSENYQLVSFQSNSINPQESLRQDPLENCKECDFKLAME